MLTFLIELLAEVFWDLGTLLFLEVLESLAGFLAEGLTRFLSGGNRR